SDVVPDLEGCCRSTRRAGGPRGASCSVAIIDGRWRCVVIGRRRPVINRRRRCPVIALRGDRGTDAKAEDPAYDRRASGVATTTMIVPAALMIVIPATMPVLGIRGGAIPKPATSTA